MKKIMGACFALFIAANSAMAWGDYGYPYSYGGYSYPGSYQYPSSSFGQGYDSTYYDQFSKPSKPTMPRMPFQKTTKMSEPVQQPSKVYEPIPDSTKPLEQQYSKLIVIFSKSACGYCQYMKPIMEQAEMKYGKDIKFVHVDVDTNSAAAGQYGFRTVPFIVYFKDGNRLDAHGSDDKKMTIERVQEKIENYFRDSKSE